MIYNPEEDSYLLEKVAKNVSKGKTVLDMGTGSGIIARAALSGGAKSVTASDVNTKALRKIKEKKIKKIHSDLFEEIREKYDLIFFNPPYLPEDAREDPESRIITSGGKKGDEIILRFLKSLRRHLNSEGRAYIVLSDQTPQRKIKKQLPIFGLKHRKIEEKKLFMEKLEVWEIKAKT